MGARTVDDVASADGRWDAAAVSYVADVAVIVAAVAVVVDAFVT